MLYLASNLKKLYVFIIFSIYSLLSSKKEGQINLFQPVLNPQNNIFVIL